ncbi:hypothetical protein BIV57_19540 [Mangrovactinospora gilvigrisea]|uniref:ABC-2 type transporter transmembrane domain-containing protein n=1 Tax=Mangrovactinospora gilvigrisea TaxID=1428644 RepID=A0A1J7C2M8_9ACTN|nr:ABC transporter permease [Mangrovactinospora gilvigrisea]OIV35816.1 hypothetical protein BIV57_19540 [Mangrovactinospora gilvigrisea]
MRMVQPALARAGSRPGPAVYAGRLWRARHFTAAFAGARLAVPVAPTTLGGAWLLLTPLLNAVIAYLLYGVLLGEANGFADRATYVAFDVIGAFVFTFTQASLLGGTRCVRANLDLVREIRFPTACLPLAVVLAAGRQLLLALGVGVLLLVAFGHRPDAGWLWALPALVLQAVFNAGLALGAARISARTGEAALFAPFVARAWTYASGVGYTFTRLAAGAPRLLRTAIEVDPPAVYMNLVRGALIGRAASRGLPGHAWALALGWALIAAAAGYLGFWQGEGTYGQG